MPRITKVLIANRGEIAVRVIRAARDSSIRSVAVYADQDRDALHARLADEAYALDGTTSADTYLVIEKILSVARRSGADAVHPGYGFLAENADFARAVIDAGLIWIGPSPDAIEKLGDKVSRPAHRREGRRAARPRHAEPGRRRLRDPGVRRRARSAGRHQGGLRRRRSRPQDRPHPRRDPRAVRLGRARGRRGVRSRRVLRREVPRQAAPRRDPVHRRSARQRRHRLDARLLAAAPQPEARRGGPRALPLRASRTNALYQASKAILREVGYVGAGTCEFLIGQDGTVSFLEVNTRLQVEHPVSEEVTGIDLVREQFRVAEGGVLEYDDPVPQGHSFEFRINGEDPGRNFFPAPGPVHVFKAPGGPGVRVDSGVQSGDEISGAFDSLLAKLIVTGSTREDALERARRALDEFEIAGLPTVLPFHRADRRRPGVRSCRRRPVHDPHPLDRDRVRQPDRALERRGLRRPGSRVRARPSSSRSAASASR